MQGLTAPDCCCQATAGILAGYNLILSPGGGGGGMEGGGGGEMMERKKLPSTLISS